VVVSFVNAKIRLYDIETGQIIMTLQGSDDSYGKPINDSMY
jgi:striatin 1/3/4